MFNDIKKGDVVLARKNVGGFSGKSFVLPIEVIKITNCRFTTSDGRVWNKDTGKEFGNNSYELCQQYYKESDQTDLYRDYKSAMNTVSKLYELEGFIRKRSDVKDNILDADPDARHKVEECIDKIISIISK